MKSYAELIAETELSKYSCSCALLPVGCMEQHGPYLPLETDILIADYFSDLLSLELDNFSVKAYKYPYIAYSPTRSNSGFAGTVSVEEEIFRGYIKNICQEIIDGLHDFVVFVSGHGPADPSLREIAFMMLDNQFRELKKQKKPVFVVSVMDFSIDIEKKFGQKSGRHADWRELAMLTEILGKDYFNAEKIQEIIKLKNENNFFIKTPAVLGIPLEYRSIKGIIGDPFPEGVDLFEFSKEIWEIMIKKSALAIYENYSLFKEQFLREV